MTTHQASIIRAFTQGTKKGRYVWKIIRFEENYKRAFLKRRRMRRIVRNQKKNLREFTY